METPQVITLTNGVRVLTVEMPHTQGVTVAAFVNAGTAHETQKLNGISHFLEHMAFKGTRKRDFLRISTDVERLGADINAYTSKDRTVYYVSGLAKHLSTFVELIGDIVLNSELPQDELERERGVIIQEINRKDDSASGIAYNLIDEVSYPGHAFGRTTLGPKANVKRFSRDDLMGYMKAQYTGSNVVVGIAGNISTEEARKLAEDHFGDLPSGTVNSVTEPQYVGGIKVRRKASFTQTTVVVGYPGAGVSGDYHIDAVTANLLGGGMSSPLFNEIREKRSLAYSVGSGFHNYEHFGQFYLYVGTTAEHLPQLFDTTCDVLLSHTSAVNEVDLERAINTNMVYAIEGSERPFRMLETAVEDLFVHNEIRPLSRHTDALQSVTVADVMAQVEKMITNNPSIAIVGKGSDEKYLDQVIGRLR